MLGQALKQSLKTGDAKTAKQRAAEVNSKYEEIVAKAREGIVLERRQPIKVAAPVFAPSNPIIGRKSVKELAAEYLRRRSDELRHGGFKSVRFSIGLVVYLYGTRQIGSLSRDDGRRFASLVGQLSPHVGKSFRNRSLGLEQLVARSVGAKITAQTQKRIVSQVYHFLDWAYHEGHSPQLDFSSVRIDQKGRVASYAVPTDDEVETMLGADHDADITALVMRQRRGRTDSDIFCSRFIVMTRNGLLAQVVRKACVNKGLLSSSEVPPRCPSPGAGRFDVAQNRPWCWRPRSAEEDASRKL